MKRKQRIGQHVPASKPIGTMAAVSSLAIVLGACSADVGRFDFPSFNLNGKDGTTSSLPKPSEPVGDGYGDDIASSDNVDRGKAYYPDRSTNRARHIEVSNLSNPDGVDGRGDGYGNAGYRPIDRTEARRDSYEPPRATYQPPAPRAAYDDTPARRDGDTIEVARGDTLYGLARRHGVSVRELMTANAMSKPDIWPGQKLRLPNGSAASFASQAAEPLERKPRVPEMRTADAATWGGSYQVRPGDSLYRIARQHNVRVVDLQRINGISDPRQMRPGITLRVPGEAAVGTPSFAEARRPEYVEPRPTATTTQPTIINNADGERRVAALDRGRMNDAVPVARQTRTVAITPPAATKPDTAAINRLRWPAKGRIISGFGQRADGTHNDGINVAVPQGADVHAAEDGEVAYAGSELKGYGNLILIRHDNGWVTAYAHADTMMVKRGDKIRRGDVIAKAGRTGQVDQPQLHFELRQGSKPVDPLPYLERL